MKLMQKIAALLRAGPRRPIVPRIAGNAQGKDQAPAQRPTPVEDRSLPLDPAGAWGLKYEPREKMVQHLNDFLEQLALESYLNGPGFEFPDQELESRVLAFLNLLVEKDELKQVSGKDIERSAGVERWTQAQQIRINRLVEWWRQQGGPDIEARVP